MSETGVRDASEPGADASIGKRPFRHRAYGLGFSSDLDLPEFWPDETGTADITIHQRQIPRPVPEPPPNSNFLFGPAEQYLAWPGVGTYRIRGNDAIDIEPAPGVGEPLLRLPLLGPVMALLLHLRGMLVLHASAIAIGNRSAIFLGDKQAGKSTTAAALVAAGHRLLTDDVVAITFPKGGAPEIAPGFPQIKLSLDAAEAVADDGRNPQPPPYPGFEKRQHRLVDRFSHDSVIPTRIYVLERGEKAAVTRLHPGDSLTALLRFSYVSRFGAPALQGAAAAQHLRQCAMLANVAPVCRLEVPGSLDRLGEMVALVERELA